jgi:hypothetical protein
VSELVVHNNDETRAALAEVARRERLAPTALARMAGISNAIVTYINGRRSSGVPRGKEITFGVMLQWLDAAGYEVVIRRKRGTKRQARLLHRANSRQDVA